MKLMVSVGEISGDLHASRVIEELKSRCLDVWAFGMGGERLLKAGCELIIDIADSAVMGIGEVISSLPQFLKKLRLMREALKAHRPDLLMLVDFPELNLRLARYARKLGIPVLYYIPPKAWAWRPGRAKALAETVDLIASIFPFEAAFYRRAGAKVVFVGNPVLDLAISSLSKEEARGKFDLPTKGEVIGLMPGSRRKEVERLWKVMFEAAKLISREIDVNYILPLAPSIDPVMIRPRPERLRIVKDDVYDLMRACDLLILASGTAALEAACMLTPMIIVYKVSLSTWAIARCMVRLKHSGLPNIIAGREIAPEYLQSKAKPEIIARRAVKMLRDRSELESQIKELRKVRSRLGSPGAARRVADLIMRMVDGG